MPEDATRRLPGPSARRTVAWVSIAAAIVGVFSTWTTDGPVTLNGTQGPNNGWLVVIVAAFALGWTSSMARGSWVGIIGVLGAAVVIAWTPVESWLDSRDTFGASAGHGLVLVVAAGVALGATAVASAVDRVQRGRSSQLSGGGRSAP